MHLRKYILATLLIFVLASCYREQDLDRYRNDELSNMLTLNSLVSADSTVQVAATKPYFFYRRRAYLWWQYNGWQYNGRQYNGRQY